MKKLRTVCIIFLLILILIISALWIGCYWYWMIKYANLYAFRSAPWYTFAEIITFFLLPALLALGLLILALPKDNENEPPVKFPAFRQND